LKPANKRIFIIIAIFLGAEAMFFWRDIFPPKELIPWRKDFPAAKQEAEKSDKLVFAYFTASWCGPCQRLKRTTWADAQVELALRRYVPVEIDIDEHRELAARYIGDSIPAYVILKSDGTPLKNQSGYFSPQEFLAWLNSSAHQ